MYKPRISLSPKYRLEIPNPAMFLHMHPSQYRSRSEYRWWLDGLRTVVRRCNNLLQQCWHRRSVHGESQQLLWGRARWLEVHQLLRMESAELDNCYCTLCTQDKTKSFFTLPTQQPRTIDTALLIRVVQVDVLAFTDTVVKWTIWINPSEVPLLYDTPCSQNVLLEFWKIACLSMLQEFVYCQSLWSQTHSPVK